MKSLQVNTCLVSSICTRGINYRGRERGLLTCYPDTDLAIAKELMEAKGVKQLPVVRRGGEPRKERKRRVIALLHYDSIRRCLRLASVLFFIIMSIFVSRYSRSTSNFQCGLQVLFSASMITETINRLD